MNINYIINQNFVIRKGYTEHLYTYLSFDTSSVHASWYYGSFASCGQSFYLYLKYINELKHWLHVF